MNSIIDAFPSPGFARFLRLILLGAAVILPSQAVESPLAEQTSSQARSGIYPHLAMFNDENECGTGGVVPWAGRLWVMTYAPHKPRGSTDKLYEITRGLERTIRPESIGGTPANRMIHRESGQLFLGPYVIDADRNVRVITPDRMPGRLTGNARHLSDPAHRIYCATMEEGFYEIDVRSLAIRVIAPDANGLPSHAGALLPGYHGKGLYSGQGRLVYANNGELSPAAQRQPNIESGCLAEWDGATWRVVRRNQFTEVTGPGGLEGNGRPESDPIWSIGWDHRSLILMLLDRGLWRAYRLPKSSHSYDGAHGWNTEWPRIRDIGEKDLLMTMHGAFWRFPKTFSAKQSAGIEPRANYLKVVGDFAHWNRRIVFGCDDSARSEFLNVRPAKGGLAPPGRSQSNLWFAKPSELDQLGPVIGRGTVWSDDDVSAGMPSDPFLFAGYDLRGLHLAHQTDRPVEFTLEVDRKGNGTWSFLRRVTLQPRQHVWLAFPPDERGAWVRVIPNVSVSKATAAFAYRNRDPRTERPSGPFRRAYRIRDLVDGAAGGWLHAGGENPPTLRFMARSPAEASGLYQMDGAMTLSPKADETTEAWMRAHTSVPKGILTQDDASVIYRDARGTWRLPRGNPSFDAVVGTDQERICREVCTERDLFNAHGTFYELPAENAGGFAKVRPITTHNRHIADYASYRGLLVLAGLHTDAPGDDPHWIAATDGRCMLWVGNVEDLWHLGKPRGTGGPWKNTRVEADQPSDPYLMTGYDRKALHLAHDAPGPVRFSLEVDITGEGTWVLQQTAEVSPGGGVEIRLPESFSAYWARTRAATGCRATALFTYE